MKKNNAFTLIELLVVVAIISILMLFAIQRFLNSTQSVQMKKFESNFKILMEYADESFINNNGSNSKVYEDVNPYATNLSNGKTIYEIDASTKLIKGTLKKEAFGGIQDYIITYDTQTSIINQYPNPIPKGATHLSTQ